MSKKTKFFTDFFGGLEEVDFISFSDQEVTRYNLFLSSLSSFFLNQRLIKLIRKNLRRFFYKKEKHFVNYATLPFFVIFIGFVQILSEYTGLSVLCLFRINLPISNINKLNYNWRTFHVLNSSNFLQQNTISDQYEDINIFNDRVTLKLTSYYQNQQNRICLGYTPIKKTSLKKEPLFFFSKNRYPIYLKSTRLQTMDTIPQKMEGVEGERETFLPLFKREYKKKKTESLSIVQQDSQSRSLTIKTYRKKLGNRFKIVDKADQSLIWKKPVLEKPEIVLEEEGIKNYFSRIELKKELVKSHREIFYEEGFKHVDPTLFLSDQLENNKKRERLNPILVDLVQETINELDILNLINEKELSFFNKSVYARQMSGYWFPDFKRRKTFTFPYLKPLTIHVRLSNGYKAFAIEHFSQIARKERNPIQTDNNLSIEPLNDYTRSLNDYTRHPQIKTTWSNNRRNKHYKRQLIVYKDFNIKKDLIRRILDYLEVKIFQPSASFFAATLGAKSDQFHETREPIKIYSWLIFTQLGISLVGFRIFRKIYQRHGREILLSAVNFIGLVGILRDTDWLKDELNLNIPGKNYRAVRRVKKSLKQAVGINSLMVHFGDILWRLRTRGMIGSRILNFLRIYSVKNNRSFILQPTLLVGAPGTGKTLLVQAIAGESKVPVLIQSGSVLKDYRKRGKGARSIQNLFRRARRIPPCIVFIDELDGIGLRREGLSLSPTGERDIIESLNDLGEVPASLEDLQNFQTKSEIIYEEDEEDIELDEVLNFGETLIEARQKNLVRIKVLQENQIERNARTEQVSILTQLLIELDGLNPLNDIMVIGATNRPYVLDPALLRPGRFYRVIELKLPDQQKRMKILNLYISRIKKKSPIPWRYFSQRLEGFSAADISAIVNESALISILAHKSHDLSSLEKGLDRITSYSVIRNLAKYKRKLYTFHFNLRSRWLLNKFFINNYKLTRKAIPPVQTFLNKHLLKGFLYSSSHRGMAYYQAGKSITEIILPHHPSSVFFALQGRVKNFRYFSMHGLVLSLMEDLRFRSELEERLVGLLSGKASEFLAGYSPIILHLKNLVNEPGSNVSSNVSSRGREDVQSATLLSFLMVEKWYLYAKRTCAKTQHPLFDNLNCYEYYQEDINLFEAVQEDMESIMDFENRLISTRQTQKWSYRTWWQKQIADEESFFDKSALDWYRIFLPEPEEEERNIEWVPPDDFYTGINVRLTQSSIYWHHFLRIAYSHIYHSLLINSFNVSYSILNKNRELLDYLVDFVLRYEKVRNHQIRILIEPFLKEKLQQVEVYGPKKANRQEQILFKSWGLRSNRSASRILKINNVIDDYDLEKILKNRIMNPFRKLDPPEFVIEYKYRQE